MGIACGTVFLLLPSAAGFGAKRNARTSIFWLPAFLALVVIFYQYTALVTGIEAPMLRFLHNPGTHARMVEGAALGYFASAAIRGKI